MSLPHSRARIISSRPGPWSHPPEVMTLRAPEVDTDAPGWDVMRERLLVPYTPFFHPGERRDHVLLPHKPDAIMVVQTERTIGFHAGYPVVELTSYGVAGTKPWKCVLNHGSQGQVGSTEGAIRDLPTVNCYWFSTSLEGSKLIVPYVAVPPDTFDWPNQTGTSGLDNNWGWYIIRREVDPLPVATGETDPTPWTDFVTSTSRPNGNKEPRPRLCAVVDYYVYDWLNPLPPNA